MQVIDTAMQTKPEPKNENTHIVKPDWFWYSIQNGFADENEYLYKDVSYPALIVFEMFLTCSSSSSIWRVSLMRQLPATQIGASHCLSVSTAIITTTNVSENCSRKKCTRQHPAVRANEDRPCQMLDYCLRPAVYWTTQPVRVC